MAGALGDTHSAVIGTKGQANSMAAYLFDLDKAFDLKGHQVAYLALGDDRPGTRLLEQIENVPFVVVQASYASPLTDRADVVLPAAIWAEQAGHYVNLEGRLQEARQGLMPPRDVRSNLAIFQALAEALGITLDENWRDALQQRVWIGQPDACR
jgi:NADH dehydrogenase/NADH:ubiquinone oxidoreductase subunit G